MTADPERAGALARAFGLLGKRWNGVILGSLVDGPLGYTALRRAVGASDSVLAGRLAELTAAGVVDRIVEPGPPITVRYSLTESGQALAPGLHELSRWAQRHLPDPGRTPGTGPGGKVSDGSRPSP